MRSIRCKQSFKCLTPSVQTKVLTESMPILANVLLLLRSIHREHGFTSAFGYVTLVELQLLGQHLLVQRRPIRITRFGLFKSTVLDCWRVLHNLKLSYLISMEQRQTQSLIFLLPLAVLCLLLNESLIVITECLTWDTLQEF